MKTHARIRYFFTAASLAAILAVSSLNGLADDKQAKSPAPATDEFSRAVNDGYDLVIINGLLRWREKPAEPATIRTVVALLGSRYRDANIVYAPELAEVGIPDLKLRAHDLPEMLEALRVASGNKFDWMGPGSPGLNMPAPKPQPGVDPQTGLPVQTGLPAAAPTVDPDNGLFVLREPAQTGQNERVVEAFNITPYIALKSSEMPKDTLSAGAGSAVSSERERILTLMKLGLELSKQIQSLIIETVASFRQVGESAVSQNLKFEYHAGANLLIVIGPREDVAVARKVVNALTTDSGASEKSGGGGSGSSEAEPLSMEAIPVKYAKLDKAYAAAMSLLEDKRSKVVVVDERTKTLLVTATKAELSAIRKAVEQLELASKPYVGDNPSLPRSVQGQ